MGLAPAIVDDVFEAIGRIRQLDLTILLRRARNAALALRLADYAYVLERGHVVIEGKPADLAEAPAVMERIPWGKSPCTLASSRSSTARRGTVLEHIQEFARVVEVLGFSSLWVPDHVVFFDRYESAYPHNEDGKIELSKLRPGILEPVMAPTGGWHGDRTHPRLGTSVEILTERNPVVRGRELIDSSTSPPVAAWSTASAVAGLRGVRGAGHRV